MKKSEIKSAFFDFLDSLDELNNDEKVHLIKSLIIDYEIKAYSNVIPENKGRSWSDEELEMILSLPATKENCIKLAKLFRRGYGSIEQIYRWSTTSEKEIAAKREDDSFIKQIISVKKKIGLKT